MIRLTITGALCLCVAVLVATAAASESTTRTVLVIHGGAGVLSEAEMAALNISRQDFEKGLTQALAAGYQAWQQNKSGVETVEAAIRVMEDSELFNAGKGAALTSDGIAELDAAIMEGTMEGRGDGKVDPRKRAGAITGVTHVKNPISAARAVMEMDGSRHVMLAGAGAESFVLNDANRAKYGIERVSNVYFWTDRRLKQIRELHSKGKGTVGAVAVDRQKNIAAGTSTGGVAGKWPGRVGDSPIIGAGTYADNWACGVSCSGTGEVFMRHVTAHDVVARMVYAGKSVNDAARETIDALPDEPNGVGGLIALDPEGRHAFAMSKRSVGMYRGYVTYDGRIFVGIFANEAEKERK